MCWLTFVLLVSSGAQGTEDWMLEGFYYPIQESQLLGAGCALDLFTSFAENEPLRGALICSEDNPNEFRQLAFREISVSGREVTITFESPFGSELKFEGLLVADPAEADSGQVVLEGKLSTREAAAESVRFSYDSGY